MGTEAPKRRAAFMTDASRTIDAVWRIESARIIAGVARMVRDVGLAEELAQDALVAALEQWPADGRPAQSGRLADDRGQAPRHRPLAPPAQPDLQRKLGRDLARELEAASDGAISDVDAAVDGEIEDDLLRLMFTACHPVLSTEARVALTLRLLGGLTTDEIARAFLVPEPTVAQRIVRAKRTLAEARVPFEVPQRPELAARLASVLEVIYLDLQRGLFGHRRRRLAAPGPLRGGAAAGPDPRRADARASRRFTAWSP